MSMETDSPVVYHGTSESRFPKEEKKFVMPELTAEERDIIRQCNKESLYFRCLPFSFAGMAAVHFAAKKGMIKTHPVWGTALSMTGAAFLGWILGKFSYRTKCEDKFLHLENSSIADVIRKKRGITFERFRNDFPKSQTYEDVLRDDSFSHYSDSDYHSSTGSLNLDVDKNIQYSGLDDRGRPSTDRDSMQYSEGSEPVRRFTTYEDRRHRNREEYDTSQKHYTTPPRLDLSQPIDSRPYSNVDSTPPRRYNSEIGEGERRTTYGSGGWDNAKLL